jgi:hypothetical protein
MAAALARSAEPAMTAYKGVDNMVYTFKLFGTDDRDSDLGCAALTRPAIASGAQNFY